MSSADAPLMITRRLKQAAIPDGTLELPYELRCRSRLRTRLKDGTEVGIVLERGQILRGGDLLQAEDGRVIQVVAACEPVSTLRAENSLELARAAYHLGNRHIALQIGDQWLRYRHDHVLDLMASGLGLLVTLEDQPFEPEGGAYPTLGAGGSHSHGHSHSHDHDAR